MKKIASITFLLLSSIMLLQARTLQEAMQTANNFIAQRSTENASHAQHVAANHSVEWVYTHYQVDKMTPAIYVFNATDENGFVFREQ